MKILITAATFKEIAGLIPVGSKMSVEPGSFLIVKIKRNRVILLITGVGMVSTCFHLTRFLHNRKFDILLNIGIAGSFRKKKYKQGAVLRVKQDTLSELGAESGDLFIPFNTLGLIPDSEIVLKEKPGILKRNSVFKSWRKVEGITVNRVHGNETSIARIVQLCNPDIESMEGAAFFYVAQHYCETVLQLRAISNYVEKRDTTDWVIPFAIGKLTYETTNLLRELKCQPLAELTENSSWPPKI